MHGLDQIIRFRTLMIAAGGEDGNDAEPCGPTRCSSWRWTGCPTRAACARNPPRRTRRPHDDEYGFQAIAVFDGWGRMIAALLHPACRPSGRKIVPRLRRLITTLRGNRRRVEILLCADSR